ncbi:ATP-binding sensor histidine kinase [Okeania sp. KiyG1]|uniref:trifunctional serine/threonine-protein kinase/ATP-binding protein/sensor histidine kinase n=1 Tax=Okeania sp. KiyG1 TaxID=2720165 RepID=UPI0019238963|nr:ATP-binding sensor histidine kinase [Okeania sp. KiyG1]GGA23487.1 serine/threonine protein kinase [Okeania sp. KiyG1]
MNLTITSLTDYEIGDLIHESDRTVVYRGMSKVDGQPVAIKLMRNQFPSFHELVQFRNQYTVARNLCLEGIVKPLALQHYQNGYALIMPDFGGISLGEYYQGSSPSTKDISQFLDIAIQIAEIVYQLHRNRIIHKDIKPANILINPQTKQVKIIDFSISTLLPRETQTIQNYSVLEGTLAYISPEQTGRMNRAIDYRSDFYSLGVTLFEMLNGRLPFETTDPMELVHCHITKTPPTQDSQLPRVLVDIVLKLMAKNAEDRYQSALGLKSDLEKCRTEWQFKGKIGYFELGSKDISDRFLIPEKLYGREAEVQQLLEAFERVASGQSELMLVAGFSGIGKTVVVNEVHKPIVRQRGYFIKGKFDQFNRNIPFSALVQSLRDLMGQLLSESDAQLQQWKSQILDAVGENGQVIVDVIPELEKIIGKQPAVAELSGSAAQNRFNLLFGKFIQVFTTKEHPLVIFLDDLQWADSASLNLMKLLMGGVSNSYLLMIGAYRDNEVFPAHPLMLTLDEMGKAEATINTITLAPLSERNINHLVADTLSCDGEVAKPLTELVYQKTKGNPFFTTQFLLGLYGDELISFNREVGYWECDITKVRQKALTDDVVKFMAQRLQKLPRETQDVLKLAAYIGNQFDLETLAVVSEQSQIEVASSLWLALQEGLVLPKSEIYKFFQGEDLKVKNEIENLENLTVGYRFLHDRVQQAAYTLIPEEIRGVKHLHIGRSLLGGLSPEKVREQVLDIVRHFNVEPSLLTTPEEKMQVVQLNQMAGEKAKRSTAYSGVIDYFNRGMALLGNDPWQQQRELAFYFSENIAEAAFLSGDFAMARAIVSSIKQEAENFLEEIKAWEIEIQIAQARGEQLQCLKIALSVLQQLGVELPEYPTEEDIQQGLRDTDTALNGTEVADIAKLPPMENREIKAATEILASMISPAFQVRILLFQMVAIRQLQLTLQWGLTTQTPVACVLYGMFLAGAWLDVERGYQFGRLAIDLLEQPGMESVKSTTRHLFHNHLQSIKDPARASLQPALKGGLAGIETGEYQYSGNSILVQFLTSYFAGVELDVLEQDLGIYRELLKQTKQEITLEYYSILQQTVANLRSSNASIDLMGEFYNEQESVPELYEKEDNTGLASFFGYKLSLCCLFQEVLRGVEVAEEAEKFIANLGGTICPPAFHFYNCLLRLKATELPKGQNQEIIGESFQNSLELLGKFATSAPVNYEHKLQLIEAERYRLLGQNMEAIDLYDRSIAGAKENEYIQEEALANELAAKFYLDCGKEKIACVYMQEAYYCYARWGAKAKTGDLEKRYPYLLTPIIESQKISSLSSATLTHLTQGTISRTATGAREILDLATLMKASRTLSEDISLEGAVANLMQVVRENAGAETVALMLFTDQVLMLTAIVTNQETLTCYPVPVATSHAIPLSIVNQVKRNQKSLVLDNAINNNAYAGDAYIQKHQPKSVLCLPLIDRGNMIGILYLENNQLAGAFTSERVEVLSLLCSQAAISLENARLYQESQNYAQKLEQTQLQLVQSEKMASIGQLVSGVAHEINNPIGFISGNLGCATKYIQNLIDLLQLYQEGFDWNSETTQDKIEEIELDYLIEDLPEMLRSMRQGTNRITEISKSMRTFSRSDTIAKVPFNIHQGIDSTLLILRHRLKANELRPEIKVVKNYGNLPEINCYPGQLNQVFMNLIANAIDALEESNSGKNFDEIKAAPNQITITTEIEDEKQQAIIRIRDNGLGINEEMKNKIFEHLFTTKVVGKGTGLGLSISRQIVEEKHGGKITCTSELGIGTEFVIALAQK